jgi:NAD(P)-dependent dehydrogenase (short-subunit alcohol dehydrogenase family)
MGLVLIIGVGDGLSASLARTFRARGDDLILAARDVSKLSALAEETGAILATCDAAERVDMERLFETVAAADQKLVAAIYNPSGRSRGPIAELDPVKVEADIKVTAYGAFLMAHHATKLMLEHDEGGALFFTGATAGVKGFANSASFSMGKFALRGLCQSLARELHPKGIHVGHFVIDGGIDATQTSDLLAEKENPSNTLDPDEIAKVYAQFADQHRSAWSWEIELRPWVETF